MKKIYLSTALLLVLFTLSPSLGVADNYQIMPELSSAAFGVKHTVGFNFGAINVLSGAVGLDKNNISVEQVSLSLDAGSIKTFNDRRDEVIQSGQFFDAVNYPRIDMHSKKILKDKIVFDVTIKGVKKELEFEYRYWGTGKNKSGETLVGLLITGVIPKDVFGMDYSPKTEDGQDVLGNELEFTMEIIASKK